MGLWTARLDVDPGRLAELERSLSVDERARAQQLRTAELRDRYVADHGWRRRLLADRLGCAPAEVAYTVSAHGKDEPAGGRPRFSASRSGGAALYAVSDEADLGVDVEEIDDGADLAAVVRRLFSPAERAAWESTPPAARLAAGYACWTRKEAYVKAVGTGLVFPLTELEVWAGDDRPVRYGEIVVLTVDAGPGFAAAVAVRAAVLESVSLPARPLAMS